jgi:hypothetical protein
MLKFISRLFFRGSNQYIYAIKPSGSSLWSRVVYREPHGPSADKYVGPFRSEVDCEEFCKDQNEEQTEDENMSYQDDEID